MTFDVSVMPLASPPLSALPTSPPQGGRSFFSHSSLEPRTCGIFPISPLEGEMSQRDRGGYFRTEYTAAHSINIKHLGHAA